MNKIKCDFCSAELHEKSAVRFGCRSFVFHFGPIQFNMDGDWAGCPVCSMLVYAERWEELKERSVSTSPSEGPTKEVLREYVTLLHQKFRENRL